MNYYDNKEKHALIHEWQENVGVATQRKRIRGNKGLNRIKQGIKYHLNLGVKVIGCAVMPEN